MSETITIVKRWTTRTITCKAWEFDYRSEEVRITHLDDSTEQIPQAFVVCDE